jgi:hypothetical protein
MSVRFLLIVIGGLRVVHADWVGLIVWRWSPIAWSEISDIRVVKIRGRSRDYEVVGVFVKDLDRPLAARSWLARLNLELSPRKPETPVMIYCALLDIEPATLCSCLNDCRQRYS